MHAQQFDVGYLNIPAKSGVCNFTSRNTPSSKITSACDFGRYPHFLKNRICHLQHGDVDVIFSLLHWCHNTLYVYRVGQIGPIVSLFRIIKN